MKKHPCTLCGATGKYKGSMSPAADGVTCMHCYGEGSVDGTATKGIIESHNDIDGSEFIFTEDEKGSPVRAIAIVFTGKNHTRHQIGNPPDWHEGMANSRLYREASIVYTESGLTPKQLVSQNTALREALEGVIKEADRDTDSFIRARALLKEPPHAP